MFQFDIHDYDGMP